MTEFATASVSGAKTALINVGTALWAMSSRNACPVGRIFPAYVPILGPIFAAGFPSTTARPFARTNSAYPFGPGRKFPY